MVGLGLTVATCRLVIEPEKGPMKQAPRHRHPDLPAKVEAEMDKLVNAGVIREVQHCICLANVASVKKKNG